MEGTKVLKGAAGGFVRANPRTDLFEVHRFHHVEFWCGDAGATSSRFARGLGMTKVAASDLSTGNARFASTVLASHDLVLCFTAPYGRDAGSSGRSCGGGVGEGGGAAPGEDRQGDARPCPLSWYDAAKAHDFHAAHGLAVRAVGILVSDAAEAHAAAVAGGATSVLPPQVLDEAEVVGEPDARFGGADARVSVAEVALYGDVVLRFVSGTAGYAGPYLPGWGRAGVCSTSAGGGADWRSRSASGEGSFGLRRLDHAVGNVPVLQEVWERVARATGFHEFAEFTAEDVGTVDSGLNSVVLASNNELVLLPINEPTFGTRRKSQIQTYLEHNGGAGLQHLALKCDDAIATVARMRNVGEFDFMPRPGDAYYDALEARVGKGTLSVEQLQAVRDLGILVDKDDQGILLQVFTKPVGDRPTLFLEIIQRLGCNVAADGGLDARDEPAGSVQACEAPPQHYDGQLGGCGGFGKGNFTELFKSIEDYERTLDIEPQQEG